MSENKFIVVDETTGKPKTGPLSYPEAQRERRKKGGEIEQINDTTITQDSNDILWVIFLIAAIAGIVIGFVVQSATLGFLAGAGIFFGGTFGLLRALQKK